VINFPMKHPSPRDKYFKGPLRHYHRIDSQGHRTWEDWVEGASPDSKPSKKSRSFRTWLKIFAIILSLLALGGIVAGLIVELS
jgi:hypothetical protein